MLGDSFPSVSIIIPCRNEERFIGGCIDSILANDYPKDKIEVLVVDGMSGDKSKEIVGNYSKQYKFIRVIDNPRRITPCAFNTGIRNATGEIVMILGSHSTYQSDYISKCVRYLNEFEADNVGGIIVTLSRKNTFIGKAVTAALSSRFGVGGSGFRTGVKEPTWVDTVFGGCYKKKVFEKVGFFNENLVSTQDMEFNLRLKRAGGKILLVPDIVSYYYTRSDLVSFCRNNFRNGFWAIYPFKFTTTMPVSWRHLVPLSFVLGLIGSALLSTMVTHFVFLFLIILGCYVLVNLAASLQIALQRRDIKYLMVMPFIFACLHFGYGLGSLLGGFGVLCSARFWKRFSGPKIRKAEVKKRG
jgi:glycosyltransferase involved in cell wall biosynthesis